MCKLAFNLSCKLKGPNWDIIEPCSRPVPLGFRNVVSTRKVQAVAGHKLQLKKVSLPVALWSFQTLHLLASHKSWTSPSTDSPVYIVLVYSHYHSLLKSRHNYTLQLVKVFSSSYPTQFSKHTTQIASCILHDHGILHVLSSAIVYIGIFVKLHVNSMWGKFQQNGHTCNFLHFTQWGQRKIHCEPALYQLVSSLPNTRLVLCTVTNSITCNSVVPQRYHHCFPSLLPPVDTWSMD